MSVSSNETHYLADGDDHDQKVKKLFNSITSNYDILNRLMSAHQDVRWRRIMVENLPKNAEDLLDVATGTGDVALEAVKQFPRLRVTGIDLATNMLKAAKVKIKLVESINNINLLGGNTLRLPFNQALFNAVTIAFGLRNVKDHKAALDEMYRVLKPDGKLIILEMSFSPNRFLSPLIGLYFNFVLPMLGLLIARDRLAYTYLPKSIRRFLSPIEMKSMMMDAGFSEVKIIPLAFGIVYLHTGVKA